MTASDPGEHLADDLVSTGNGDRAAFRRVYEMTASRLLAICFKVTQDRGAAEDILQSVFLKVWQSAGRFDRSRSRPMTWLCSIARNSSIDWYRSQRLRREGSAHSLDSIASASEASDDRIIREEGEEEAMRLVHDFDEELESQVRRIYLEGMTYAAAAEADGVPLGTLKSRVRRALLEIRKKLSND